jgi:hypothetical protein
VVARLDERDAEAVPHHPLGLVVDANGPLARDKHFRGGKTSLRFAAQLVCDLNVIVAVCGNNLRILVEVCRSKSGRGS